MGTGLNVGFGDGLSLGGYGEVGYRVGGTGFGAGATVSHSMDYNFKHKAVSNTTAAGAYASLGAANVSVGTSYNHQANRFDWSATVGVGVGNGQSGMGFAVGYGSRGAIWGVGGWTKSPVNAVAENRAYNNAQRAKVSNSQNQVSNEEIKVITYSDEQKQQARSYVNESAEAGHSREQIVKGLEQLGYKVVGNRVSIKTVNKIYHYDLDGAEHKGVPTPHVQQSVKNINPKTGQIFYNKDNTWVRPMNQGDIRILRNYFKRR